MLGTSSAGSTDLTAHPAALICEPADLRPPCSERCSTPCVKALPPSANTSISGRGLSPDWRSDGHSKPPRSPLTEFARSGRTRANGGGYVFKSASVRRSSTQPARFAVRWTSLPRITSRSPKNWRYSKHGRSTSRPCSARKTKAWVEASMRISTGCERRSHRSSGTPVEACRSFMRNHERRRHDASAEGTRRSSASCGRGPGCGRLPRSAPPRHGASWRHPPRRRRPGRR